MQALFRGPRRELFHSAEWPIGADRWQKIGMPELMSVRIFIMRQAGLRPYSWSAIQRGHCCRGRNARWAFPNGHTEAKWHACSSSAACTGTQPDSYGTRN